MQEDEDPREARFNLHRSSSQHPRSTIQGPPSKVYHPSIHRHYVLSPSLILSLLQLFIGIVSSSHYCHLPSPLIIAVAIAIAIAFHHDDHDAIHQFRSPLSPLPPSFLHPHPLIHTH